MTRYILTALSFLLYSCQAQKPHAAGGMIIDPAIRADVERHIGKSQLKGQNLVQIYENRMMVDLYENDRLVTSTMDKDVSQLFKSFYVWQNDTLNIDGAFGLWGGAGFCIKIVNGKATLYHMLASDDFPSYSYTGKDSLVFRLEVPCTDTKIILSAIPDTATKPVIYGYVEFKSGAYFSSYGAAEIRQAPPRQKQRANMKIYFKSAFADFSRLGQAADDQ